MWNGNSLWSVNTTSLNTPEYNYNNWQKRNRIIFGNIDFRPNYGVILEGGYSYEEQINDKDYPRFFFVFLFR